VSGTEPPWAEPRPAELPSHHFGLTAGRQPRPRLPASGTGFLVLVRPFDAVEPVDEALPGEDVSGPRGAAERDLAGRQDPWADARREVEAGRAVRLEREPDDGSSGGGGAARQ